MTRKGPRRRQVAVSLCLLFFGACRREVKPETGKVLDEARRAGRAVNTLPAADEDYFREMDGGIPLTPDEVKGRNTWIVWTGGNDRFWSTISVKSLGALDFLKTLSSHPSLKFSRDNRWKYLGLVNEPCFEKATGPDPQRHGLWLDKRRADCPPDPFEKEQKYPGVALGARGRNMPVGSYYGWASGIVGLRLFPNPDFDESAARKWDPVRFYTDKSYYLRKDLIEPYRVGMSCAFCHVGPSPTRPPADPENPQWANLASNVGAQYFWIDRIFSWEADESSFVFQLFHTSRPGALDTSLVSTDSINNPRTMNAVYALGPRLEQAKRWGTETLGGGSLDNRQFDDYVPAGDPLAQFFEKPSTVRTPRVLKDGSDSVGALGALNRVYLNIGLFSEEWLLHFNALVGGKPTTAIEIAVARKNSTYWEATEAQTPNLARFFLKGSYPHKLKDAPGGEAYLTKDKARLARGKEVFADRCARCHSSKLPPAVPGLDPGGCAGAQYLDCFNRYWSWTKTDDFKKKVGAIVTAEDFLDGNFLSTDLRVPVTLLETNACSPLATNALADNVWDNFSSRSYKELPSVGTITVHHPITPGLPGQPLVHRPLLPEQHPGQVQLEPLRGSEDGLLPGLHREAAVAGEARERPRPTGGRRRGGAGLPGAPRRQGPQATRGHRPDHSPELPPGPRRLPPRLPAAAPRPPRPLRPLAGRRGRDRDRAPALRHAGQPPRERRDAARRCLRRRADQAQGRAAEAVAQDEGRPQVPSPAGDRRAGAEGVRRPGRAAAQAQQVPRLRGQPGALLRDELLQGKGRSRPERRRQAGPHRVPEDVLKERGVRRERRWAPR